MAAAVRPGASLEVAVEASSATQAKLEPTLEARVRYGKPLKLLVTLDAIEPQVRSAQATTTPPQHPNHAARTTHAPNRNHQNSNPGKMAELPCPPSPFPPSPIREDRAIPPPHPPTLPRPPPQVSATEDNFEFGPVVVGSTAHMNLTLVNASPIPAVLHCDLSAHSAFEIVLLTQKAAEAERAEMDAAEADPPRVSLWRQNKARVPAAAGVFAPGVPNSGAPTTIHPST